jgi:hypothetical protein
VAPFVCLACTGSKNTDAADMFAPALATNELLVQAEAKQQEIRYQWF